MFKLSWALRKLARLSPPERRLLLEAAIAVPVVHQLQQRLPFARWHKILERSVATEADLATAQRVSWAVKVAADYVPGSFKCLPRAYATHVLLARHGCASRVHVGVAKDAQGKIEAHAWVVAHGEVVMGQVENLARFVELPDFSRVLG